MPDIHQGCGVISQLERMGWGKVKVKPMVGLGETWMSPWVGRKCPGKEPLCPKRIEDKGGSALSVANSLARLAVMATKKRILKDKSRRSEDGSGSKGGCVKV